MPLLLLTPRQDIRDTFRLAETAEILGWKVQRSTSYQPNTSNEGEPIVLYGETLFTTLAAKYLRYTVLEPDFDLLVHFPQEYLRRNVQKMLFEEARRLEKPFFVKPADGNKVFDSRVYRRGADLPANFISKSLPVLVSTPVTWEVEYRFFVLEQAVVTYSSYARFGELVWMEEDPEEPPEPEQREAVQFCTAILQDPGVDLPPAVVLDIGKIQGKGWAVIEPNPVSSSGIYGCDPIQVLHTLRRACVPESSASPTDRRWAVNRKI